MKRKIILTILFVCSVILNISVVAHSQDNSFELNSIEKTVHREDALHELQITMDQKVIKTKYETTRNFSQNLYRNIYVDQNDNEYHFYPDNRVASYIINQQTSTNKRIKKKNQKMLTEKELVQLAAAYASNLYQNAFVDFSVETIEYNSTLNYYSIRFVKYYGEKALNIIGPVVNVNIYPDGTINACITSDLYDFEDFNETSLSGLTKNAILEFVEDRVRALYDDFTEIKVEAVYLVKTEDNYVLKVHTNVKLNTGDWMAEVFPYVYLEK